MSRCARIIAYSAVRRIPSVQSLSGTRSSGRASGSWEYGLGEGVVSGLVQADQFIIDASGEDLARPRVGSKAEAIVQAPGGRGIVHQRMPQDKRDALSLDRRTLRKLAHIAEGLELHYGQPLDIEFAVEDGEVYILQARPITSVAGVAR